MCLCVFFLLHIMLTHIINIIFIILLFFTIYLHHNSVYVCFSVLFPSFFPFFFIICRNMIHFYVYSLILMWILFKSWCFFLFYYGSKAVKYNNNNNNRVWIMIIHNVLFRTIKVVKCKFIFATLCVCCYSSACLL